MRFLVTGGTGRVGNAVARRLAARGDQVIALVPEPPKARELLPDGAELAPADYPKGTPYERSKQRAEKLVLEEAAAGIEVVIANPASVYGPGPLQTTGLDRAFRDAIRKRLPALPPGGMTLAYVDDVAEGH